jgi:hypothetical protein
VFVDVTVHTDVVAEVRRTIFPSDEVAVTEMVWFSRLGVGVAKLIQCGQSTG